MPNWTSNTLITDNPRLAAIIRDAFNTGRGLHGSTIPMPPPLAEMSQGYYTIDGVPAHVWRHGADGRPHLIPADELRSIQAEYGTVRPLDWAVDHWGTKSDPQVRRMYERDDGTVQVWFDTAWSPPKKWLAATVAMHPEGRTELAYAEGGMGFWGRIAYRDGQVEADQREIVFWREDWDWDEDYDPEDPDPLAGVEASCREHLTRYGLHTGG
jgi:hypothetical protein